MDLTSGGEVDAVASADFESEVAAALGPFVGLFGQHCAPPVRRRTAMLSADHSIVVSRQ